MVLTEVRPVRSGTDLNWLLFKRLKNKKQKNKNKNKQTMFLNPLIFASAISP